MNSQKNSKVSTLCISILILSMLFIGCLNQNVNHCTGRCAKCEAFNSNNGPRYCTMCYRSKLVPLFDMGSGNQAGKCEGADATIKNCQATTYKDGKVRCSACTFGFNSNADLSKCEAISFKNCATTTVLKDGPICTACLGKFGPSLNGLLCEAHSGSSEHCKANSRYKSGVVCSHCGWDRYLNNQNLCVLKPESSKPCRSATFTDYNKDTKGCDLCWFDGGYFATGAIVPTPPRRNLENGRRITVGDPISINVRQTSTKDSTFDPDHYPNIGNSITMSMGLVLSVIIYLISVGN